MIGCWFEIVTAANMSGIKEAQAGFLGMSSSLTAMIAGLGIAVVAGRSAVDIAEQHEKAENDLAQAIKARGGDLDNATKFLDGFISSNRQYISSQAEIITTYAALLRAGIPVNEAQKDLNRILDISIIKGRDVSDMTQQIILAEHGRLKGLSDLGVTTTKFTDAEGNQVASSHDVAKAFGEVDIAADKGRGTLTKTDQATRTLSNDWQDIAQRVGPPLIDMFDQLLRAADFVVQKLEQLGRNKTWADAVSAGLGQIQNALLEPVKAFKAIVDAVQWLSGHSPGAAATSAAVAARGGYATGRGFIPGQHGFEGIVSQPTLFLAGEAGSERVAITPGGGGGGGGASIHVHIHGSVYSDGPGLDRLTMAIANRLSYVTGR